MLPTSFSRCRCRCRCCPPPSLGPKDDSHPGWWWEIKKALNFGTRNTFAYCLESPGRALGWKMTGARRNPREATQQQWEKNWVEFFKEAGSSYTSTLIFLCRENVQHIYIFFFFASLFLFFSLLRFSFGTSNP